MLPPSWMVRPGQRSPVLSRAMCSAASSTRRHLRSRIYVPTLKQAPADAATPGHQLMYRAGMIRKSSAGHFSLLPLGIRVLNKLERLIDQHMDSIGGQKTQLPSLLPRELWERSGRWDSTGDELMKMHDRHGNEHCLAPTHEEAICAMVAQDLVSYKQLPLMLYQVGPKFRDEVCPLCLPTLPAQWRAPTDNVPLCAGETSIWASPCTRICDERYVFISCHCRMCHRVLPDSS